MPVAAAEMRLLLMTVDAQQMNVVASVAAAGSAIHHRLEAINFQRIQ